MPEFFSHSASLAQTARCNCGKGRRQNAILCRDCWLHLPLDLRSALPFKAGAERDRIGALLVEYADITFRNVTAARAAETRSRYKQQDVARENAQRRKVQAEIAAEILGGTAAVPSPTSCS